MTFTKEAAKAMTEEEKADDAYDETNSGFRLGGSCANAHAHLCATILALQTAKINAGVVKGDVGLSWSAPELKLVVQMLQVRPRVTARVTTRVTARATLV